jgi:GAF domain-containing protein
MLYDEKGKRLLMKASFGPERAPDINLRIGEAIAGYVMKTGEAELINDFSLDARSKPGMEQIRSLLCAPLKWKETGYGLIHMSKGSDALFTPEDLKTLRSVGIYTSIAIENAVNAARLRDAADSLLKQAALLDVW